jgi:catechol 2,3-dioxygenase
MLLPAQTHMGRVALTVADLDRSLDYYQQRIGLHLLQREGETAVLGTPQRPLLVLQAQPGVRPARGMTGLYHFALLVPSRPALAHTLRRLLYSETPLSGASDHGVSEALYLTDPDGHGIELYRDRPREEWQFVNGRLNMVTEPFDVDGVLAEVPANAAIPARLPEDTVMGHVHLHVADMPATLAFYQAGLGFDLVARYGSAASFLAAGGYHHHLGVNTWAGVGAPPPPPDRARLLWYEILLPDDASLDALTGHLAEKGMAGERNGRTLRLQDPAGNHLIVLRSP